MIIAINKNQVEYCSGKLVAEASSIGLAPGEWPEFIAVLDDQNEGFLFQRGNADPCGDDVGGFHYYTRNGMHELLVIND